MKKYTWIFALFCVIALLFAGCGDSGGSSSSTTTTTTKDKDTGPSLPVIFEKGKFAAAAKVDVSKAWGIKIDGDNLVIDKDGGLNFEVDKTGYTKLILDAGSFDEAAEGELWDSSEDGIVVKGVGPDKWMGLNDNGKLIFPLENTEADPDDPTLYGFMLTALGGGKDDVTISKIYLEK